MDINTLASAIVIALTPYLPIILGLTYEGGKAMVSAIGSKFGEITIDIAKKIWNKISDNSAGSSAVSETAKSLAASPNDPNLKIALVSLIKAQLEKDSIMAQELSSLIGGEERIQVIIASEDSEIEDAEQQMDGTGFQQIDAQNKSKIKKVKQTLK
jgi:hypothetical protein